MRGKNILKTTKNQHLKFDFCNEMPVLSDG